MSKRAHVVIRGRVQGVFFRAHTRDISRKFNLDGWVRNRPDGSVEAVFEGNEEDVESVLDWCHDGPPEARVDDVEIKWEEAIGGLKGFEIRYN